MKKISKNVALALAVGLALVGSAAVAYAYEKPSGFDPDKYKGERCINFLTGKFANSVKANLPAVTAYKPLAEKYGKMYGVPPILILSIIGTESSGNPSAYRYEPAHKDASIGLMQTLVSTARKMGFSGSSEQLYNPETSIKYGTKYLAYLYSKFHNWVDVIAAYNGGPGAVYSKTGKYCYRNQLYVNKVLTWAKFLKPFVR